MWLAADVGGTKTLIGVFRPGPERPLPVVVREYVTLDFDGLDDLVETFFDETGAHRVTGACLGVAGPVTGMVARLTHIHWLADAGPLASRLGDDRVVLVNDLEAMAYAVPVLDPDELVMLQDGVADATGNAALIAAGTGLGEALLHNVDGRFLPSASEGGHADFAARTEREFALAQELARSYGRVDNERVISGPGLVQLFRFTHGGGDPIAACRSLNRDLDAVDMPAAISTAALEGTCEACGEALDMFVEAFGAEAGNLALRTVATAGIYVGGGIAPRILPALQSGMFLDAFHDKPPMADMLRTMPVAVIKDPSAGLLGAAVRAQLIEDGRS